MLYKLAARLLDATQVLEEIHSIFSDEGSSNRSKESALRDLKKNVIPLMKHVSDTVHKTAVTVAPVASTLYAHQQLENQKKHAAAASVTPIVYPICQQTLNRKSQPL